MGDLSEHFSRHEFACKCGCGRDTIDAETLKLCEIVREFVGYPVTVASGYRCEIHNRRVGGGTRSQHLYGRAADLVVTDPASVYEMLCKRFPDEFGFGRYGTFVHVDTRSNGPARWYG